MAADPKPVASLERSLQRPEVPVACLEGLEGALELASVT
jgi:hypothetical protein